MSIGDTGGRDGAGADRLTETTTRSWGSRLGDSFKGIVAGLLLIAVSVVLLFWNEGRAVQTARSLAEGAGIVVEASASRVDPANEGKLVHVSGEARTGTPLADPDFGVSVQALKLTRVAEMYQWKEEARTETRKSLGGSEETVTTYSYIRTWSDSRIDSGRFRRPEGHGNPQMRYMRRAFAARDAALGAFRPGEQVLQALTAETPFPVDGPLPDAVRRQIAQMGQAVQVVDGRIYIGADPSQPRIGDQRIFYLVAPQGPLSIVARQAGQDFAPYQTEAGDRLIMVRQGSAGAAEMFSDAERANVTITWLLRGFGALAMFMGFGLILRPLAVLADVVPAVGSLVGAGTGLAAFLLTLMLAPLVIAAAWLWYRPLVSAGLVVVAAGAVYGMSILRRRRAAVAPEPRAA